MDSHYLSLITAYCVAAILWFLINHFKGHELWNSPQNELCRERAFSKPYLEFAYAITAVLLIIAIGQLYTNNLLIPNPDRNALLDALNQGLIFSPTIGLILIRSQSLETLWLRTNKIPYRSLIGLGISLLALLAYWLVRSERNSFPYMLSNIYHPGNISQLVQVFLEDITIAMIFVRLAAWIGERWTVGLVAALFAAGHIPSMISSGYSILELQSLVLDTAIGIIILLAVSKSKDIWWFVPVHFVLDMSQYHGSPQ